MAKARQMALTPDLVARVHRALDDPGPDPSWAYHTDADYDAVVSAGVPSRRARQVAFRLCFPDLAARAGACRGAKGNRTRLASLLLLSPYV